ncbi:MAG: hypothetical protein ACOX2K_04620 [Bacillota bacterium]
MYGNYDERGLRIPQYYGGNAARQGNISGGMGSNYAQQGIGTTRTEQMMQGNMGGLSSMMQADHRTQGFYGQNFGGQFGGPSNQYGQSTQYGGANRYPQANYGQGNQYGNQSQFGQFGYGNQFGSPMQYQQSDIGTTRSEQMMRGGMGGVSPMMQADHNIQGSYGQAMQYGQQISQYGQGGYGNQFGSPMQYQQSDIGTTLSEQTISGGMGGMSAIMQADHNLQGSHGQGNQYYGQQGNQYSQSGFGSTTQYQPRDIGTTRSEQSMSGGMGGVSTAMQADQSIQRGYGQGSQYGQQTGQYSQGGFGSNTQYQQRDIGTTRSEQSMSGGMGGVSTAMQADRNIQSSFGGMASQYGQSNYYGGTNQYSQPSQYGQSSSTQGFANTGYGYGSQYSNQMNQNYGSFNQQGGVQNPGDTPLEQAAKQNINPGGFSPSDEF